MTRHNLPYHYFQVLGSHPSELIRVGSPAEISLTAQKFSTTCKTEHTTVGNAPFTMYRPCMTPHIIEPLIITYHAHAYEQMEHIELVVAPKTIS